MHALIPPFILLLTVLWFLDGVASTPGDAAEGGGE